MCNPAATAPRRQTYAGLDPAYCPSMRNEGTLSACGIVVSQNATIRVQVEGVAEANAPGVALFGFASMARRTWILTACTSACSASPKRF